MLKNKSLNSCLRENVFISQPAEKNSTADSPLSPHKKSCLLFQLTSSPHWKGRGFPPKGFIVPTIDSGLHLSFEGQSRGSENHSHLKGGLSSHSSSPLKEGRDDGCSSHSPIKPSIELGRSAINITKIFLTKKYLNIRGLSIPASEVFRPLNTFLCKNLQPWNFRIY